MGMSKTVDFYLGPAARAGLAHPALVTWNVFSVLKTLISLVSLKTAQSGVPIVLMMFLYEARARSGLAQEHQLHNWDPIFA